MCQNEYEENEYGESESEYGQTDIKICPQQPGANSRHLNLIESRNQKAYIEPIMRFRGQEGRDDQG